MSVHVSFAHGAGGENMSVHPSASSISKPLYGLALSLVVVSNFFFMLNYITHKYFIYY